MDVGFEPGFVAGGVGDEDVLGGEALQLTLARGGNGGAVEVAGQVEIAVGDHAVVEFVAVCKGVGRNAQGTEGRGRGVEDVVVEAELGRCRHGDKM
ncbi:MAG: hypothetical protein CME20_16720 [Gemmatimonadetes bacterium]|nr:hypothetical protein [Gemmatimonadota bacterium]